MRLPGAPERWSDPHGTTHREHDMGILWVFTGDPGDRAPCEWLPDITDAATGGAITGLLGLAGGWIGRSAGSRKRHDASYDEGYAKAKAEAEEARNRENAAYDEAQARLHAMYMPPPKA